MFGNSKITSYFLYQKTFKEFYHYLFSPLLFRLNVEIIINSQSLILKVYLPTLTYPHNSVYTPAIDGSYIHVWRSTGTSVSLGHPDVCVDDPDYTSVSI